MYGKWGRAPHWAKNLPVAGNALRPPFSFPSCGKENGLRPVEKKKCFGGSVRASADLLPPAREGWLSLAAVRDGNAFPLGSFKPGEVPDTLCADFTRKGYARIRKRQSRQRLRSRCRWPSLAGQGPTHRSAPTRWGALTFRRGGPACPPAGKALRGTMERQAGSGAGAMRLSAPMTAAAEHAAQGRDKRTVRREPAGGRRVLPAPIRETPVRAEARRCRSATKSGLFFWTGPRPVFFSTRLKRKWGAESIAGHRQIPPAR